MNTKKAVEFLIDLNLLQNKLNVLIVLKLWFYH